MKGVVPFLKNNFIIAYFEKLENPFGFLNKIFQNAELLVGVCRKIAVFIKTRRISCRYLQGFFWKMRTKAEFNKK